MNLCTIVALILPGLNFHRGFKTLAGWKKSGIILYPTSYNFFKSLQMLKVASVSLSNFNKG